MPCTKRMRACTMACLHKQNITEYHLARYCDELKREQETAGYATEMSEYNGPMMTFKEWLEGRKSA